MNATYWQSELDKFEQQPALLIPTNLYLRVEVLRALGQLTKFGRTRYGIRQDFRPLLQRAVALQERLAAINEKLFGKVREQIVGHELQGQALRSALNEFTTYRADSQHFLHYGEWADGDWAGGEGPEDGQDYIGLNVLVDGIFQTTISPEQSLDAVIDMIHFEMTPLSVILELVDRIPFDETDVFVDIGAGLGQICMLVHLLSGVRCHGIEVEPAYVDCASELAVRMLGDPDNVIFEQADARTADFSVGTVFFLFTPFVGKMFDAVMEQLRKSILVDAGAVQLSANERARPLICTYGDITLEVAELPWLQARRLDDIHPFRLAIFEINRKFVAENAIEL